MSHLSTPTQAHGIYGICTLVIDYIRPDECVSVNQLRLIADKQLYLCSILQVISEH